MKNRIDVPFPEVPDQPVPLVHVPDEDIEQVAIAGVKVSIPGDFQASLVGKREKPIPIPLENIEAFLHD